MTVKEKVVLYWHHISSHHGAAPVISLYSDELMMGPVEDLPSLVTTQYITATKNHTLNAIVPAVQNIQSI